MQYQLSDLKQIFEPLGFVVTEEAGFVGTSPAIRKALPVLAARFDWPTKGKIVDLPLWVEVWPGGPMPTGGEDETLVGVTGVAKHGMGFTGQVFKLESLQRLRQAGAAVVHHIEASVSDFLCPTCRGLLTKQVRDCEEFFGCQFYRHYHVPCSGSQRGPYERMW